jgi:hypothetical protein
MFKGIIVFLLLLTIILFPIPLKITLKYSNKVLGIYIYNKKLIIRRPAKKALRSNRIMDFIKSMELRDLRLIIYKIRKLKLKPILILNTKLEYGLNDAALVAILYGMIHSVYSFMYLLLQNIVKVKGIDLKVIPHFEENDLSMEILSIIYMNLAKIIYMAFITSICLLSIKKNHKKTNMKKYKGGNVHG